MDLSGTKLVLASGGDFMEGLIWIVIVVFWIVGQISAVKKAQRKRKEAQRQQDLSPPTPKPKARPTTSRSAEDELREFIESLGGKREAPRPKPAPMAQRHHQPHVRPFRASEPARPATKMRPSPPPPPQTPTVVEPPKRAIMPWAKKLEEVVAAESASSRFVSSRSMLVSLSGLRTPISMSLGGFRGAKNPYRPDWRKSDDLRQAVIGKIILSPPVALRQQPDVPGLQ